jgi:regulator of replication initiation timing
MNANAELVINELTTQIANLSKEKAIYAALSAQLTVEVNQLRQENESLKKRIEELEKQNEEKKEKPEK